MLDQINWQYFNLDEIGIGLHGEGVFIGPRYIWGPIYVSRSLSVTNRGFADLTDVSLVDEDIISILADDTNWAIQGTLEM